MDTIIGIVVLVVGLLVSIALHEVGHMVPAKRFGVRVSEYFVGFGPTLWSRKRGETEYGVKAIPLGGFVRLVGMVPPAERVKPVRGPRWAASLIADAREASVEEIEPGEDHRAFYHLSWWRKIIVMFGGPVVNLVLAVLLFTVVLSTIGTPTASLTVGGVVQCVPAVGAECAADDPASPAVQAGLEVGDTITAVDGSPVTEWTEATGLIADRPGQKITLDVDRAGQPLNLTVVPAAREVGIVGDDGEVVTDASGVERTETVGYLGIYSELQPQRQPLTAGAELTGEYLRLTANVIVKLPVHVWDVSKAALGMQERSNDSIMGVVGIGRVAGEITGTQAEGYGFIQKFGDMLMLLGGLNLALFAFNMIPLLPLDGGHIASALWQAIKNGWAKLRKRAKPAPVDVARMMPLAYGVFAVLLVMGAILIYADIVAPVTLA